MKVHILISQNVYYSKEVEMDEDTYNEYMLYEEDESEMGNQLLDAYFNKATDITDADSPEVPGFDKIESEG